MKKTAKLMSKKYNYGINGLGIKALKS